MEWYIPITMLSGIGLIILSTPNLLIALNDEIKYLNLKEDKYSNIIQLKLVRLKHLNLALVEQYLVDKHQEETFRIVKRPRTAGTNTHIPERLFAQVYDEYFNKRQV